MDPVAPPPVDAFRPIRATSFSEASACGPLVEQPDLLGYIGDGSWVRFDALDFGLGASYFQVRISTPMPGGSIEIHKVGKAAHLDLLLGVCEVGTTDGWDRWATFTCPILAVEGIQTIRLVFRRPQDIDYLSLFNVGQFSFAASLAGLDREASSRIHTSEADSMSPHVSTVPSGDHGGGLATAAYRDGDHIAFARVNLPEGTDWIEARVGCPTAGAKLEVHILDLSESGDSLVGVLSIPVTGPQGEWRTVGTEISPVSGRKILQLIVRSPSSHPRLRLHWLRLTQLLRGPARAWGVDEVVTAADYDLACGVQTEPSNRGGKNLGYISDGAFVHFSDVDFGPEGRQWVSMVVASGLQGGFIDIDVDGIVGTVVVPRTGDWQRWVTVHATLKKRVKGRHAVRLLCRGSAPFLLNLLSFSFPSALPRRSPTRVFLDGTELAWEEGWVASTGPHQGFPLFAHLSEQGLRSVLTQAGSLLGWENPEPQVCVITTPRLKITVKAEPEVWIEEAGKPAVSLTLPEAPFVQDQRLCLPLALLGPLCGLQSRWDPETRVLNLRSRGRRTAPRGRLTVRNGRLLTDCGSVLRGPSVTLDREDFLPSFAELDRLKSLGFNAIHVYAENSEVSDRPGALSAVIDELVAYGAQEGLYLVLGTECGVRPGRYDETWLNRFWDFYAPRYAGLSHVAYDLVRQPCSERPPYPTDVLAMERRLWRRIRDHAPQTVIMVLSYYSLGRPESILEDLRVLELTPADRAHTVVSWSGFDLALETIAEANRALNAAGWATLCTELPNSRRPGPINPFSPELSLVQVCESTGVGWLGSFHVRHLANPVAWEEPSRAAGIQWTPDP